MNAYQLYATERRGMVYPNAFDSKTVCEGWSSQINVGSSTRQAGTEDPKRGVWCTRARTIASLLHPAQ
jgi:hypothetical protein